MIFLSPWRVFFSVEDCNQQLDIKNTRVSAGTSFKYISRIETCSVEKPTMVQYIQEGKRNHILPNISCDSSGLH